MQDSGAQRARSPRCAKCAHLAIAPSGASNRNDTADWWTIGATVSSPEHWQAASRRFIQSGRANSDPRLPEMVEGTSNLVSERIAGRLARLCGCRFGAQTGAVSP